MLALAPGVLGSAAFLLLGRPPHLEHLAWAALAATPLLALAIAVVCTRGDRPAPRARLFLADEWLGALPAVGFGLVAAGPADLPGRGRAARARGHQRRARCSPRCRCR